MKSDQRALIVIDLQNDYFPIGKYPLWNAETILSHLELTITSAKKLGIPVIIVQHIANSKSGAAPFFNAGTLGVEIHPRISALLPDAPVVIKEFADSFHNTDLEFTLNDLGVSELYIAGMMTQNCVTHTAISKAADKYKVTVLSACCTTVDPMIHALALRAMSTRITISNSHLFEPEE